MNKMSEFVFALIIISGCNSGEALHSVPYIDPAIVNEKVTNGTSTYKDLVDALATYDPILKKTKTIGDFIFETDYQSHLQLAIMNNDSIRPEMPVRKQDLVKINEYKNLHSLHFSMENRNFKSELLRLNVASADDYSRRISYYSFYCNNDVYLVENGKDTLRGAFLNFERTFDVSPKLNFTFVFESKAKEPLETLNFVFNDVVFNNGKLNFEFNYKTISVLNTAEIKKLL